MHTNEEQIIDFYNKVLEINHERKSRDSKSLENTYLQLLHIAIFSAEKCDCFDDENRKVIDRQMEYTLLDYLLQDYHCPEESFSGMQNTFQEFGLNIQERQNTLWLEYCGQGDLNHLLYSLYCQGSLKRRQIEEEKGVQSREEAIEKHTLKEMRDRPFLEKIQVFSWLKTIDRKEWIKRNVDLEYRENDMEHTMQMVFLAYAMYLNGFSKNLSFSDTVQRILIHDVGEIIIDDICEDTEEHKTKHDREKLAAQHLFAPFEKGRNLYSTWLEKEEQLTERGNFIHIIDKFEPILKAKWLDTKLGREDLFPDFLNFELKRETFKGSEVEGILNTLMSEGKVKSAFEKAPKILNSKL